MLPLKVSIAKTIVNPHTYFAIVANDFKKKDGKDLYY